MYDNFRFGKSPTGELRWQLPVAYEPEESLYDVTGTSDIKCKQFSWDGEGIVGTEDCLFLNVYVPGQLELVKTFHCTTVRLGNIKTQRKARNAPEAAYLCHRRAGDSICIWDHCSAPLWMMFVINITISCPTCGPEMEHQSYRGCHEYQARGCQSCL